VVAGDLGDPQQLGAIVPAASRALGPPQPCRQRRKVQARLRQPW